MAIGEKIAESRSRKGLSQEQLATRVPASRESIAKYETSTRNFPNDLRADFTEALDDSLFTKEMQREATGGIYIPYLDGPLIDHHPAALIFFARRELKEAKAHLNEIDVSKPLTMMSDSEVDHIHRTVRELLDGAAAAETLVIDLCEKFDLSFSKEVKSWITTLVARQLKQRRYE